MASIISESTGNDIPENGAPAGMNQRDTRIADRPQDESVIRVKPRSYQPTKAELEEAVTIDATPEELALAILRPVRMIEDPDS